MSLAGRENPFIGYCITYNILQYTIDNGGGGINARGSSDRDFYYNNYNIPIYYYSIHYTCTVFNCSSQQ